jgi:hypothetical protein
LFIENVKGGHESEQKLFTSTQRPGFAHCPPGDVAWKKCNKIQVFLQWQLQIFLGNITTNTIITTKYFSIILFFAFYVVVNESCGNELCREVKYSFAIQSQLLQDKDSIKMGDTIFLQSHTPKKMPDVLSGATIDYSNSTNFGSVLSIGELIKDSSFPRGAVLDFAYLSVKGKIYNDVNIPSPNTVQQLTYGETDTEYELKVAVIPQKKGIYVMAVGDGMSSGRRGKAVGCQKADIGISLINTNQHTYFYQLWRPGYQLTDYDLRHIYCFKVY